MTPLTRFIPITALALAACPNFAQQASAVQMGKFAGRSDMDTLHMSTKIGSFKIIDGEGRLEFTFKGTLLVSKLEGQLTTLAGNLRKEYDKNNRAVYTGGGTVAIEGKWRGVQWFGSDMTATYWGKGVCRITGEFDRNLETGYYWYRDPAKKKPFPSSNVIDLRIPAENYGADLNAKPQIKQGGTAGGGN